MKYEWWDVAIVMVLSAVAGMMFLLGLGFIKPNDQHTHRCYAPCIVVLQPNTLEDEFWFDYGWETDSRSVVTIYSCNHERTAAQARACDRRPD